MLFAVIPGLKFVADFCETHMFLYAVTECDDVDAIFSGIIHILIGVNRIFAHCLNNFL